MGRDSQTEGKRGGWGGTERESVRRRKGERDTHRGQTDRQNEREGETATGRGQRQRRDRETDRDRQTDR